MTLRAPSTWLSSRAPMSLRNAEAGQVGADRAAQVVNGGVGNAEVLHQPGHRARDGMRVDGAIIDASPGNAPRSIKSESDLHSISYHRSFGAGLPSTIANKRVSQRVKARRIFSA